MNRIVHLNAHNIQRPSLETENLWPQLTQAIPNFGARSAGILLAELYKLFWETSPEITLFFDSDSMGGLELRLDLTGPGGWSWRYEQSLRESWSSIECLVSEVESPVPAGVDFQVRLNLIGWGTAEISLTGPQILVQALKDLLASHFETLEILP